jgi:transcription initiation factor TFIIIB Brf1 subunit/transcription initiation factor TFIIB
MSAGHVEPTGARATGGQIGDPRDAAFRDSEGELLPDDMQARFSRLKILDESKERISRTEAEYRALRLLNNVSKLLTLNGTTRESSKQLFKMIAADSQQEMTSYPLFVAVSILFAVHSHNTEQTTTLEEIVSAFEKCGHRISVRSLVREALLLRPRLNEVAPIRKPEDYLDRVLSVLMNSSRVVSKVKSRGWEVESYENELRERTSDVLNMIPKSKIGGQNPFILTVASAYAADRIIAEEYQRRPVLTQRLTSSATEVAEYSIRDSYSTIRALIERERRKEDGSAG